MVCCQMYPMGCRRWVGGGGWGGLHPDSRAVAARAHLSAPGKGRRRDPLITSGACCQRAADCKWPLLNVTKGAICMQLPRWHQRGKTHGRTASGQMCPKPACVSDRINVYVPVRTPSILLEETTKPYILLSLGITTQLL